jgi:hypothetical protein
MNEIYLTTLQEFFYNAHGYNNKNKQSQQLTQIRNNDLGENMQHVGIADGSQQLGTDGENVVARKGGAARVPAHVHARLAAPRLRVVQHVIVQQRSRMNHLTNNIKLLSENFAA